MDGQTDGKMDGHGETSNTPLLGVYKNSPTYIKKEKKKEKKGFHHLQM